MVCIEVLRHTVLLSEITISNPRGKRHLSGQDDFKETPNLTTPVSAPLRMEPPPLFLPRFLLSHTKHTCCFSPKFRVLPIFQSAQQTKMVTQKWELLNISVVVWHTLVYQCLSLLPQPCSRTFSGLHCHNYTTHGHQH